MSNHEHSLRLRAMNGFINVITPAQIHSALERSIIHPDRQTRDFIDAKLNWIGRYIRFTEASTIPELSWLNMNRYMHNIVGRVSTPQFWNDTLNAIGGGSCTSNSR